MNTATKIAIASGMQKRQMDKDEETDRPAPPQNLTIKEVKPTPYAEGQGKSNDIPFFFMGVGFFIIIVAFFILKKKV